MAWDDASVVPFGYQTNSRAPEGAAGSIVIVALLLGRLLVVLLEVLVFSVLLIVVDTFQTIS